jgi:phosphopantothenoylcysteine decarboxylase/phosphopantothenate--cysteine ligase
MGIIHPDALEFACGRPPVTELTGGVEHVDLCGLHPDRADLVLVAPSTANTISKIARGVDDTPVTTVVSTAIGTGIPVLISPAMHGSMYRNPFVTDNMEALETAARDGRAEVAFVQPIEEESKAKLAPLELITSEVLRRVGRRDLLGVQVLVIGGAGYEPLDDMRILTNRATGRTGVLLAMEAYHRSADVTLLQGLGELPVMPSQVTVTRFGTNQSLLDAIGDLPEERDGEERVILMPAAITDYRTEPAGEKIGSGRDDLTLELEPTPKVAEVLRERYPGSRLVLFKAESRVGAGTLEERARSRLEALGAFMVVGNDLAEVSDDDTRATLFLAGGETEVVEGTKALLAGRILDLVAEASDHTDEK